MILVAVLTVLLQTRPADLVYDRVLTQTALLELSYDSSNKCLHNLCLTNRSDAKRTYFIRIWMGGVWYFRHEIELEPLSAKYYNDAFIICERSREVSVELIEIQNR